MTMRAASNLPAPFIPGAWTVPTLPTASAANLDLMAWCTDVNGYMVSDGAQWRQINCKRFECFNGSTDASGNYSVSYVTPYAAIPNVQPVTYPPASATTRVRVTASTVNGFTVKTETNAGVTVLGIDVLSLATANVAGVPVRILVVES